MRCLSRSRTQGHGTIAGQRWGEAWLRRSGAALALLLSAAGAAGAQVGIVGGVVTDQGTLTPLAGAQVTVAGTQQGAVTDERGRFTITQVAGTDVTLDVRRIGYRSARVPARVGATDLRIELAVVPTSLEAVVVTGTAGATQRREIGNAISTIDASRVLQDAPVPSVQGLLNGRAPGVVIQTATGNVGTGARIRVRGASSFSLSNEPLVYIDGVRANSTPASGPQNQDFESSSISRINDINPDEIESIEVIKGPAAATLYGTEASNGVIQIITKKGRTTPAQWNAVVRQGVNYLHNPAHYFPVNWGLVGPDENQQLQSIDIVPLEESRGNDIFRTGNQSQYNLSVGGGSEFFHYYASGAFENSQGAEPSNDRRHTDGRVNLQLTPSSKLTFSTNLGYVTGPTNLGCEAGCGGRVWTTLLATPTTLDSEYRGFGGSGIPSEYDQLYHFSQQLNRFTGSLTAEHRPTNWFTQRVVAGTDRTRETNIVFRPRIDALFDHFDTDALGGKAQNDRSIDVTTVDYSATGTFNLLSALRSSTSVGGQYYKTTTDTVYAEGSVFPAPGVTSINSTTIDRFNAQDIVEDASLGFYVQEQLGWRDRLFVTGAVRSDDASAFGQDFDRVYYPKFSVSWVVSDEPFWPLRMVNSFKLRSAYGESGKQPRTYSSLATYEAVTGAADQPSITPQFIGNPDLGPERGKEYEVGFDAGMLNDRLTFEATYYNKRTTDAILERQIAPSIGYPGLQFFNAGGVKNVGWELQTRVRPVDVPRVAWDLTINLGSNDNKVTSLGDQTTQFVQASQYNRHQIGYPIGAWFMKRVVSAEFDPAEPGTAINAMCADTLPGSGGKAGGAPVLCAGADGTYGTADDAPSVFLGRVTPKLEGSVGNTVTLWNRVRLYGLVDFKRGFRKLNGNERVRCTAFDLCLENYSPELFDPARIAQIQSPGRALPGFLIQDASFAKLREISATYLFPDPWARRAGLRNASLTVAGRNLRTWTDYQQGDPEGMFLGGTRGGEFAVWQQATLPSLQQFLVTLNVGF